MSIWKSTTAASTGKRAILAAFLGWVGSVQAAETLNYRYDALGRLKATQITAGPRSGVQRSYEYDSAGNRRRLQVTGATGGSTVAITPTRNVVNLVSSGGVLAVTVNGSGVPNGMVTFTEGGVFLGSAYVVDGQASVFLEGLAQGLHTITATYWGDNSNESYTYTFTIRVQNLSWLPAVLDLILSN